MITSYKAEAKRILEAARKELLTGDRSFPVAIRTLLEEIDNDERVAQEIEILIGGSWNC